jgi:hypothetical protein
MTKRLIASILAALVVVPGIMAPAYDWNGFLAHEC